MFVFFVKFDFSWNVFYFDFYPVKMSCYNKWHLRFSKWSVWGFCSPKRNLNECLVDVVYSCRFFIFFNFYLQMNKANNPFSLKDFMVVTCKKSNLLLKLVIDKCIWLLVSLNYFKSQIDILNHHFVGGTCR